MAQPTNTDRVRQVVVTLAEVFCVVGTLVGVGVLGTRVQETAGGALSAEATRIAPAGPAFSIWSVIYLGLLAYTIWQWLPRNATSPWTPLTGWLAATRMVLNAAWLLVTANVTAAFVSSSVQPGAGVSDVLAVVVLAVAAALGLILAATLGGRYAVAVAMAWGLGWIAVGRLTSEPDSTVTAVAAGIAAVVVLIAAAWRHSRGAPRTAAVS